VRSSPSDRPSKRSMKSVLLDGGPFNASQSNDPTGYNQICIAKRVISKIRMDWLSTSRKDY
jgi:hypothetical protein